MRNAIFSRESVKTCREQGSKWDFADADTRDYLHSLHPYPAKFIPQIPREAIRRWSKIGDTIMDPFCGSGTALLEAIMAGRNGIGIDNNGVACLVSRAKTYHYTSRDIDVLEYFHEKLLKKSTKLDWHGLKLPEYKSLDYWFSKSAIEDLGRIRFCIDSLSGRPELLSLAILSSLIVRCSKQDSDTRYCRTDRRYVSGSAIQWFCRKLADTISRLKNTTSPLSGQATVHLGDARHVGFVNNYSVDLIVTSPPYLNAYDYHKYHRHRLHWVDADIAFARDMEIGKHDQFTRPKAEPGPFFDDMRDCFNEWARVLKSGGRALIITGDSIVNGECVPVGDHFVELLKDRGLKLENRWIRNIKKTRKTFNPSHARITQEHLILVRKPL